MTKKKKIPGIHNYCDRWCERCAFTRNCAIYEDDDSIPTEEKDVSNKAFWDRLSANFAMAITMLETMAKERGIDLTATSDEDEAYSGEHRDRMDESKNHPLGDLSWKYSERSREWLKSQPGMVEKLEHLRDGIDLGIQPYEKARSEVDVITECLEVIQWYQDFIHVKFMRALMGRMRDGDHPVVVESISNDSNGSAKIAIISIERSMQAWAQLYKLLPHSEDDFLEILGMLDRLKFLALKEFPNATSFKRPGFDD